MLGQTLPYTLLGHLGRRYGGLVARAYPLFLVLLGICCHCPGLCGTTFLLGGDKLLGLGLHHPHVDTAIITDMGLGTADYTNLPANHRGLDGRLLLVLGVCRATWVTW